MDNPLAKYLPKEEDKLRYSRDLIERANAQFSCIDILNKEFGYYIPKGGVGSTKLHCLWGWEHKDGGTEKCMRYYWESDTAYCFRDHGVIDVVTIRAVQKGLSKVKTAKLLLQEAGVFNSDPWNVRIQKAQEHMKSERRQPMDMKLAQSMFNQALRSVEGYGKVQYKPDIVQAKNSMMEELDPSWNSEQLLEWIDTSKTKMRDTVENWLREI
jgi:hypothetical protein